MNTNQHLSTDVLVDAYYGICEDPAAVQAHLGACEFCAGRWREMARVRSESAEPANVPASVLAVQRRKVHERIEQGAPKRWKVWVPAAAAAGIALGVMLSLRPAAEPVRPDILDTQLFADVYSLDQSYEPSATAPLEALFEEN